MSKHVFTIEVEFEDSAEYEAFLGKVREFGGEITDEESDFR